MAQLDRLEGLNAEKLREAIGDQYIGNQIQVVAETTSTNDLAWQLARDGSADGLVVFAERQTAGRGQRGNRWESAAHQGLWFSILLRPNIEPAQSPRLTAWAAQSIVTTAEEQLQIAAKVKPPNDVFSGERKIAGVLVEMRVETSGSYAAIAGIGVNVNQMPADFPQALQDRAGSLAMAAGGNVDRPEFAAALLRELNRSYRALFG